MSNEMTVTEFLALCKAHGWHFTHAWVTKRLRELAESARIEAAT